MVSSDQALEELIEIRSIRPATIQVRTCKSALEQEAVKELAASIRKHGLIQPITVRTIDSGFEIVAGHRRYLACKLLRWKVIPARLRVLSDKEAFEIQLIENMHRLAMDPIEEAEAFKKYILDYGWGGTSSLANVVSKSEQYVSGRIQLLKLPKDILVEISQHKLKASHALEIVNLEDPQKKMMTEAIVTNNLSVQNVREIVKQVKQGRQLEELIGYSGIVDDHPPSKDNSKRTEIKLLKRGLLVLRMSMARLDGLINDANGKLDPEQRAEVVGILMQCRLKLHSLIDEHINTISTLNRKLE